MLNTEQKRQIIRDAGGDRSHIVEILLKLQAASGQNCVSEDDIGLTAEALDMTAAQVREIVRFYAMLETKPQGRYVIGICNSCPCSYSRSQELAGWVRSELGVAMGETTPDGLFSLQYIPCVGACDIGPVLKIGDEIYGNLTQESVQSLLARLRAEAR